MKILVFANNSGGLHDFRGELIAELLKTNTLIAATPFDDKIAELRALGCTLIETPVDRRGVNPARDLSLFVRYRKLLRAEKPDLVITYTIKPNVYGGLACRLRKIPYAVNITGLGTAFQKDGLLKKLVTFLYKAALKRAKVVFFENSENMRLFREEKIVREEQCCLLNGAGVNLTRYTCAPYPPCEGPVRFLFVGRVMREKGVDELFAAMERLNAAGVSCTLDVLGNYEEDYAGKIRACENAGWLRYHGYQPDVRPFIGQAHCFVLPSWHEGMANTNLECAAMGRPLITSDIPGCREAVLENESGFLCQPKNADSLYDAMTRFAALPAETRAQMGAAGRRHMEEVFDKRKVVKATMEGLEL